jgi:hypothetical protein
VGAPAGVAAPRSSRSGSAGDDDGQLGRATTHGTGLDRHRTTGGVESAHGQEGQAVGVSLDEQQVRLRRPGARAGVVGPVGLSRAQLPRSARDEVVDAVVDRCWKLCSCPARTSRIPPSRYRGTSERIWASSLWCLGPAQ